MAASLLSEGTIPLHTSVYPETCIAKAAETYRAFVAVDIVATEHDTQIISLGVLPAYVAEASKIRFEFLNYLLDLAVQHYLARQ